MQAAVAHHARWTALAATGVIFGAAYMLDMIQRIFYAGPGSKSTAIAPRDLDAREHLALWPVALLFVIMGVASPYWMRAIDSFTVTAEKQARSVGGIVGQPYAAKRDPLSSQQVAFEQLRQKCNEPGVTCYDINGKSPRPVPRETR